MDLRVVLATFAELAPMRRRLAAWLRRVGASDAETGELLLAVSELATNALEAIGEHGSVVVTASTSPTDGSDAEPTVHINVTNPGIEFDGTPPTDDGEPDGRLSIRGRGLLVVDAVVDERTVDQLIGGTSMSITRRLGGARVEETRMAPQRDAPAVDDDDVAALLRRAADLRRVAYAPYSRFRTGAAVLTDAAEVVGGVLVENVSLGLASCAERNALFATVAAGQRPVALALAAPRTDGRTTWPCGACLQVMLELGGPDLVVAVDDDGTPAVARVGDLLPRGPVKD